MDIMNLKDVVENVSQYNVVWHEPWTGLNDKNESITVDARITIPVEGAIALQRESLNKTKCEYLKAATPYHLLLDFISIHWAVVAPKESQ